MKFKINGILIVIAQACGSIHLVFWGRRLMALSPNRRLSQFTSSLLRVNPAQICWKSSVHMQPVTSL